MPSGPWTGVEEATIIIDIQEEEKDNNNTMPVVYCY